MKATDLMIGDWVLADKEPIQIKQVCEDCIICDFGDGDEEVDCFEPIPLTPEILEKNGFKKEIAEDKIHNIYTLTENSTAFSIKYARSVFQWFYPIDIKYVHKLQHIMRLCEIKKEIIL